MPLLAFGALEPAAAATDSTALLFPGDENDHLKRDVAVFIVVSAFVAIFIIKLFIEGDDPETPDEKTVRNTPPTP